MQTIFVHDPPPAELQELLARRRQTGADRHDELWEGVLHMAPAPHWRHALVQAQVLELLGPAARGRGLTAVADMNLGEPDDYRVPDASLTLPAGELFNPTAVLAVEILPPGDTTLQKLPFYAAHGVDEVVIVDPDERTVRWLALDEDEYVPIERSSVIDLSAEAMADRIDWPACLEVPEVLDPNQR